MNARGLTLIELLVVVIAVAIMAGFALERFLPLIGRAERTAFMQVRSQLQSALLLEAAERIGRGESETLAELAESNPFALLLQPPGNYLGPMRVPPADLPRLSWYFDESRGRLVYLVGRYARFRSADGPPDRIELDVRFVYEDRDGDGRFDPRRDRFGGLRLEPSYAFEWPE